MLHLTRSTPDILSTARRPVNGSIYGSTRFRVEPPDARRPRWSVPRPRPPNFLRTASVGVKAGGRAVDGKKLILTVDLTEEIGPSSSGKNTLIASTEGNANVPGVEGVKVGL